MLISCPKCHTVYDIKDDILQESGRRFRCAQCGNVWQPVPEEVKIEEPALEVEQNIAVENPVEEEGDKNEINEVFARLADHNQSIFANKADEMPAALVKKRLGINKNIIFIMLFLIIVLSLFYARYEIVRTMPFMGKVYAAIGVKAVIPGYGLDFQNITRREFEEDYIRKMEIKGFIVNTSKHMVDIPTIKIDVLDNDTNVLQSVETTTPIARIAPQGRISFNAIVVKPSAFSKYVLITFAES